MELTPMQATYWAGREAGGTCGGVSAHLYAELDCTGLDPDRLSHATKELIRAHPMLRMRITPAGQQVIQPLRADHDLVVEDLSQLDPVSADQQLLAKRQRMTHQKLPLDQGRTAEIGLTLLPGGAQRLHVDLDMIAADPSCFGLLLEDLASLYEEPGRRLRATGGCYFDYLKRLAERPGSEAAARADRDWWRDRMGEIPPAPDLPWLADAGTLPPRTDRLSAVIDRPRAESLRRTARGLQVTPTALFLALFAAMLGQATGSRRFRLNLPGFFREPILPGADRLAGDFTRLALFSAEADPAQTLAEEARRAWTQLAGLLSHPEHSGVALLRDLSRASGRVESAPVVFTSGLDLPGGSLLGQRARRVFGPLIWTVSQAPHVALDVQVAALDGGILINWDMRLDALPEAWLRGCFDAYLDALTSLAEQPTLARQPLAEWLPRPPRIARRRLNSLQQAYLLGRGTEIPLGGVPMQEFREYRGRIDPALLRQRLEMLVRRHEALRSHVDIKALTVEISEDVILNLRDIDLTDLDAPEAEARLAALRHEFSQAHCDLSHPPWQVLLVHLPQAGQKAVLTRFDALILDGASIASILAELFADDDAATPLRVQADPGAPATVDPADAAYWRAKLAPVEGPPQLPWRRPLHEIRKASWRRESMTLPREDLARLVRIGARQKLFRNSVLMATLLEVLARWTPDLALCVGVPVAPPASGTMANRSSFIAVDYRVGNDTFLDRARILQADILEGMDHPGFSGIDISRMLLTRHGGQIALPVVITNGLGWDRLPPDNPMRLTEGLTQTPQVAMDLRLSLDAEGNLVLAIDHVQEAVAPELVRDLLASFARAFAAIRDRDDMVLRAGDFLPPAIGCDMTGEEYRGPGFLERIAARLFEGDPARPALICGDLRLDYGALAGRVRAIMAGFAARGLTEGQVVAICLPRGPDHLAITLAAALSGLVWVPVDAGAPPERRDYLLDNCAPDLIVAETSLADRPSATPADLAGRGRAARPDQARLAALARSDRPGYYLYTSGTTGRPKCVVVSNRATANVIGHTLSAWAVTPDDVVMSVTPLHHDMSVFDIMGTIAAGATLVMPGPGQDKDAVAWNRLVRDHGVTLWCSVPAIVEMLLACEAGGGLDTLRLVAQGGDYIKPATITRLRQLLPRAAQWSLGGPTETTIWSIWHPIAPQDRDIIPYGRALPGNRYLILNPAGEPCPAGVTGRIHTAGVNLALGYLAGGQLSQSDFVTVTSPEGGSLRAFRSGDLGRFREDGTILFSGRVAGYVKLRGVRVSLADIEAELACHPALRQVLVVDHDDPASGEATLSALVVGRDGPVPAAELRRFARERLPQSHLPDRFVAQDALPLSANGKPDRHHARQIALQAAQQPDRQPPQSHRPSPALAICLEAVGKPATAGIDDDTPLMSLGLLPGHFRAIAEALRQRYGLEISPAQLLRCRTAGQIGALLSLPSTSG